MEKELAERIALFRFGVIAPLVDRRLSRGEQQRVLEEITTGTWEIPGSTRTTLGRSTVLKWLTRYRRSGGNIEALKPQVRSDKGNSRSIDGETELALLELKREHPEYSLEALLTIARERGIIADGFTASKQSIYRLFAHRGVSGLTKKPVDRRKFEAELPNDLWQADAMYGPKIPVDGLMRRTYLFAIIDDHSRLITHAQFYPSETIDAFSDCLQKALEKRGLPRKLYTDNGSAFRTHRLRYACGRLGIALLHSRAGIPEGRGKIERFFRTVRSQLMPLLTDLHDLDALNTRLHNWIDNVYLLRKHSSIASKPLERYLAHLHALRPAPRDLRDYFRVPANRKVDKDRTVSLNGRLFEAPAGLIGRRVTLLYHKDDPLRVEVLLEERSWGFLTPLDPQVNARVRRTAKSDVELDVPSQPDEPPSYSGGSLFGGGRS